MEFGLPDRTLKGLRTVFRRYPQIDEVLIYGSRAKGNYRPGSDIDLTLKGADLKESILSRVLVDLDDLNPPYLMDVSLYDAIESVDLRDHIDRIGQTLYPAQ